MCKETEAQPKDFRAQDSSPISSLEINRIIAETDNLKAATRKATAEAENAEYQFAEQRRRRNLFESILSTAQGAVILALLTLVFQILQFGYTSWAGRQATQEKQWRDSVSGITFKGDAKSVAAALTLETFFKNKRYGADAKSLVGSILPFIESNEAFDQLFEGLAGNTAPSDETFDVYTVARAISLSYSEKADLIYGNYPGPASTKGAFESNLSDALMDKGASETSLDVKEATHREWEIDTVSHGLRDLWSTKGLGRHGAKATCSSSDLQLLILKYDNDGMIDLHGTDCSNTYFRGAYLHDVDFSGANLQSAKLLDVNMGKARLAGAHLDNASIDGANLGEVNDFENSTWSNVAWWKAARLSPPLCAFLGQHGSRSGLPLPPRTAVPACV